MAQGVSNLKINTVKSVLMATAVAPAGEMAFNFCLPQLKPNLTCDKPSTDGYEVTNLASSSVLNNGFMPASFIKPPYCISITFPCPIELHKIVFNGKVRRQTVQAVEIFSGIDLSSANVKNNRLLNSRNLPVIDLCPLRVNKLIARATQKENHVFVFENTAFRRAKRFAGLRQMPGKHYLECSTPHRLNSYDQRYLMGVTEIGVKVVYAGDGGMGAIQWLEIWGQPARNTMSVLIEKILMIHADICAPKESEKSLPPPVRIDERGSIPEELIPDDFVDPLTHDLMTFPILLPCGQSIDSTTHEKYIDQEAKWGRAPNDPFTGQPYSESSKFIPNCALKARIDEFLLRNSEKLQQYRLDTNHAARSSKTVSVLLENPVNSAPPQAIKRSLPDDTLTCRSAKVPRLKPACSTALTTFRARRPAATHQDELSNSLDAALMGTLSSLPSFLKSSTHSQPSTSSCAKCANASSDSYRLPCSHIVCRTCALHIRQKGGCATCPSCSATVDASKITKCHGNRE
ncbi:hypothetical protein CAPTEDRAFT_186092 [Capitella teleta]|uniref:U-box domain-containing protein n=1 Tax=Capitella teleta TaxID=283909 RepID=R7TPM6_CAPTE|nr:hypothetical protein CAPTEDRAFT_186092 [Capitella teleta]|eukprot:ELT95522.1 hypothetical protein CAPTEDRAFT_186092 [Capitella teleta]